MVLFPTDLAWWVMYRSPTGCQQLSGILCFLQPWLTVPPCCMRVWLQETLFCTAAVFAAYVY